MILIEEIIPKKVSGRTSLLVSFKYNQGIVEAIKTVPNALYHKKDYTWEIPISSLSFLLDTLTPLDDIELRLITKPEPDENNPTSSETDLTETEISQFRVRPFDHQIEAINFLLQTPKALLLDAPGCGKTLTTMYYAETLHKRGLIDHCLLIVGFSSLKQNWKKEIKKFSNESCVVIGEKISKKGNISYASLTDRAEQLRKPIEEFFVVINCEVLQDSKVVEAIIKSKNKFGLILVDEIHKVSGTSSERFHGLKKLQADFKVGMTGSLITNNPISAYGPLCWTENDAATLTMFKSQYCIFGGFNNSQIIGYKNLPLLQNEIEHCSMRRTFDQISSNLPEKIVELEIVEMTDAHKKFYEAIKTGVKEEADKINLSTSNLLALTTRLRQATSAPAVLTSTPPENSKVLRCVDLVEELVSQQEKVVVFCNFKETVYDLAHKLAQYHPLINTGDQSEQQISENIDSFQTDANSLIFLGTHARVGTGITLNAAKYLICVDTPWTYANFDQSACRIYRINNINAAFIKVLACANTIDERVWNIIETKKELADYLVDGMDNTISTSLNDELRSIINSL